MKDSPSDEFQKLLQNAIDGEISAEELYQLQNLAKDNPALLEEIADHFLISSLLKEDGGVESIGELIDFVSPDSEPSKGKPKSKPIKKLNFPLAAALATAAVILFSFSIWLWTQPTSVNKSPIINTCIAKLKYDIGVKWSDHIQPIQGSELEPGFLSFDEGFAHFEFYSGAQVIVEGPAKVELISPYYMRCLYGNIRARVPEQAQGFIIHTPSFDLIDHGTEFGLNISKNGKGDVTVFEGEVELKTSTENNHSLFSGESIVIDKQGGTDLQSKKHALFPDFENVKQQAEHKAKEKLANWRTWIQDLRQNPNIVAIYDFERGNIENSSIVGSETSDGRWPGKGAIEFRQPGDRVRTNIPGEFSELTMMAWIRVDTLPNHTQALLLTDEHRVDHVHWQINRRGMLHFGARVLENETRWKTASPSFIKLNQIGSWIHVASTYNQKERKVCHYYNGKRISEHDITTDRPMKIGKGDIGNWSAPYNQSQRRMPLLKSFKGRMDEMIIWNKTLSENEIAEIYQEQRP